MRDRVDDALALDAAQAGLDHFPLGGVDHDRHAGDVGLAGDQVEEAHHGGLAVQHGLVHVDVDDLGAVLHLLARDRQRLLELAGQDHAGEGLGAGDVGAFADVDEQAARADGDGLQAGQLHGGDVGLLHSLTSLAVRVSAVGFHLKPDGGPRGARTFVLPHRLRAAAALP
jgi:hypothetical protein